jgi:hypothetical protein
MLDAQHGAHRAAQHQPHLRRVHDVGGLENVGGMQPRHVGIFARDEVHVLLMDACEQHVVHGALCTVQVWQQPVDPSTHVTSV